MPGSACLAYLLVKCLRIAKVGSRAIAEIVRTLRIASEVWGLGILSGEPIVLSWKRYSAAMT